MKIRRSIHPILALVLVVALLVSGCAAISGKKDLAKIVATPSSGNVELVEAFVTHDPMLLSSGKPLADRLPGGLKKVYLGIKFKNLGTDVDQFKIDYKITYKGLIVDTEFDSTPSSWKEQSSGTTVVILPIRKKDSSPFENGEYNGQLLIDGKVVAEYHWIVGGGED